MNLVLDLVSKSIIVWTACNIMPLLWSWWSVSVKAPTTCNIMMLLWSLFWVSFTYQSQFQQYVTVTLYQDHYYRMLLHFILFSFLQASITWIMEKMTPNNKHVINSIDWQTLAARFGIFFCGFKTCCTKALRFWSLLFWHFVTWICYSQSNSANCNECHLHEELTTYLGLLTQWQTPSTTVAIAIRIIITIITTTSGLLISSLIVRFSGLFLPDREK